MIIGRFRPRGGKGTEQSMAYFGGKGLFCLILGNTFLRFLGTVEVVLLVLGSVINRGGQE